MKFDHISTEQGLSNFTPFHIIQDKQGYLWIGTEDGLNRYDGYSFTVYRHSLSDTSSISSNTPAGLCVDSDGNLWVATNADVIERYDMNTNKFVKYRLRGDLPLNHPFVVGRMLDDDKGILWICTNNGAVRFNTRTAHIEEIVVHDPSNPLSLTNNEVRYLCKDSADAIWIGTSNGVNRLDKRTNTVSRYFPSKASPQRKGYDDIFTLAVDGRGVVWIGTAGGLLRFDSRSNQFIPSSYRLSNGKKVGDLLIHCLFVDDHGVLWVGTRDSGLLKHEPATDTFIQQQHDPANPRSIADDRVSCIYQDRSGVLWAGLYRAGLSRYDRRRDQFTVYSLPSDLAVYAVYEDSRGTLWLGTSGEGIVRYKKEVPDTFRHNPTNPHSLANSNVYSFHEEAGGDMWVGHGWGLDRYVRATGVFKHYEFQGLSREAQILETKVVYTDKDGELWVGSNGVGLLRYDRVHDKFVRYTHNPNDHRSIGYGGVWSIYQDSRKRLWIGTFGGGLNLFDKATNTFSHFVTNESDTNSLSANAVYCIAEDARGNLWMGTFGGGICRLDTITWKFKTYSVEHGLPDNFVKQIIPDAHGNLWLSTDKGLSYFKASTGTFTNYKERDGLHNSVFLSGSSFKNKSGVLYFGGKGGVTAFHPDSLKGNVFAPSVVITSFKVLEAARPPLGGFIADSVQTMTLGYRENFFSFEFISTDFTAPDKNQFAYMLEGLDKDWVQAGPRRYASYTKVLPGIYLFKVRGTNSDGVWSPNTASVRIVIDPPFWERWWFRTLATLLLLGIGIALYNYRVNRLLQIERLRVRIASDLHDDVGASLTRISLQSELIQEGIDPEEQQNYLKSISTMSRELVTSMSDIVWSIDSRNDSIGNLLDKMRGFGSTVLSAKDINFHLAHSGFDTKKKLSVDVRENIYLLYKEAVNNIVKHAEASRVDVILRNDSDKFTMLIVDNGKGWEGTDRVSGHGTKNMKMRAKRLGGTVEFVHEEGTRVILAMKRL